jgi:hypothetical protein
MSHSERGQEQRELAALASAEARRKRVEMRESADELARLSPTQLLRRRFHENQEPIVNALIASAKAGELRAQEILWNRLEGKPIDRVQNVSEPSYSVEDMLADLAALPETDHA